MNTFCLIGKILHIYTGRVVVRTTTSDSDRTDNNVLLSNKVSEVVNEYCNVGDTIAIKGNIVGNQLFAEKVSFLKSTTNNEVQK